MKHVIGFILLLFTCVLSQAQSPMWRVLSDDASVKEVGRGNPWAGATITSRLAGDETAGNTVATGTLMYDIRTGSERFHLPIVGDVSIPFGSGTDFNTNKGFSISVQPYYEFNNKGWDLVIYSGLAVSAIPNEVISDSPQRFKAHLGIEALIQMKDADMPVALSFNPAYISSTNLTGNVVSQKLTIYEFTGILPIASKTGLLAQYIVGKGIKNIWQIGIAIKG